MLKQTAKFDGTSNQRTHFFTAVRTMPLPVLGLTLVFAVVPFASAFTLESPFTAPTFFIGTTHVLAYWLLPLTIAYALVRKHYWFLPLYLLQCTALTVHTVLSHRGWTEVQLARLVLIGLMVYVGVLMGNRNFLYPLLTRTFRSWRRSVRFKMGHPVHVAATAGAEGSPALLVDCSRTGLQVSVHPEQRSENLRKLKRGDRLEVRVPAEGAFPEVRIALELAWTTESSGAVRYGCRALDRRLMAAYLSREVQKRVTVVRLPVPRGYTLDQDIQETALVLWLACIALSFALPAFA